MKRIRYLSCLLALAGSLAAAAQDFNPASPAEPGVPPSRLTLAVSPAESGSVSGGGLYVPGQAVRVSTSAREGFVFERWTDKKGNELSRLSSFSFTKTERPDTLVACYRYQPGSPAEPTDPVLKQYFQLTLSPTEGGSASGGGRYQAGTGVWLSASVQSGYDFLGWFDTSGALVSAERSFTYVTTTEAVTLTPRFRFNPSAPAEPPVPVLSHDVAVEAADGGTASASASRVLTGSTVRLYARANEGYRFERWLRNGEPYTALPEFTYTMEDRNVTFRAEFRFEPAGPAEPSEPVGKQYAYYLMSVIGKPGDRLKYPVYLTSLDVLCDMTFQLTFPKSLQPDLSSLELSEKAQGYAVSCAALSDTSYVVSLVGGTTAAGNTLLLRFDVPIPDDIATGTSYAVKINQVSVTEPDGTHLTASTRNGRLYVYRTGDTNGDGNVDVLDQINMVRHVLEEKTDVFIPEVSDVNEDGGIDSLDLLGLSGIVLTEQ